MNQASIERVFSTLILAGCKPPNWADLGLSRQDAEQTYLWALGDYADEDVLKAAYSHLKSKKSRFWPSVGDLIDSMPKAILTHSGGFSGISNLVRKAGHGTYADQFESIGPGEFGDRVAAAEAVIYEFLKERWSDRAIRRSMLEQAERELAEWGWITDCKSWIEKKIAEPDAVQLGIASYAKDLLRKSWKCFDYPVIGDACRGVERNF